MPDTFRIAVRRFDGFDAAIQQQWDAFAEASGTSLRLEFDSLDLNPLVDALFTRGGLKDRTYDVAFVVTDWIADAVAEGALLDLAPLMRKQPLPDYPDAWSPALTRFQQIGDAVYGLPYHDGPECLIYRKDLFDDPAEQQAFESECGRPLALPKTWDEFETVAHFFTRPDDGLHGTLFAAYPDGHNTVYDFCIQLWSRGGELHDAQGRPTIATQPAIDGLDFYRRLMADRTVTPPGLEDVDSVKSGELFAAGSIAMMVNWLGFAAACELPGCPVKGKIGVANVPSAADAESASLNVYWVLAIGAGSRNKDIAWDFLRHCATPQMDRITTVEGGIGCRLSTWQDPEINAIIPYYDQLEALHRHTRELPRSRELPKLVHIIDDAVQTALRTDEPSAAILQRAQHQANDILLL
jgi:multiple sugar transport system substrate-binding protein